MKKKCLQLITISALLCAAEECFGICLPANNMTECVNNCSATCKGENNINILIHPSNYCLHLTNNPCDCVCLPFFPPKLKKSEGQD